MDYVSAEAYIMTNGLLNISYAIRTLNEIKREYYDRKLHIMKKSAEEYANLKNREIEIAQDNRLEDKTDEFYDKILGKIEEIQLFLLECYKEGLDFDTSAVSGIDFKVFPKRDLNSSIELYFETMKKCKTQEELEEKRKEFVDLLPEFLLPLSNSIFPKEINVDAEFGANEVFSIITFPPIKFGLTGDNLFPIFAKKLVGSYKTKKPIDDFYLYVDDKGYDKKHLSIEKEKVYINGRKGAIGPLVIFQKDSEDPEKKYEYNWYFNVSFNDIKKKTVLNSESFQNNYDRLYLDYLKDTYWNFSQALINLRTNAITATKGEVSNDKAKQKTLKEQSPSGN